MENVLKNYPSATPEVSKVLGIKDDVHTETSAPIAGVPGLPVLDGEFAELLPESLEISPDSLTDALSPQEAEAELPVHKDELSLEVQKKSYKEIETAVKNYKTHKWFRFLKTFGPYIAIFVVGIGIYYLYFSNFSFLSLLKTDTAIVGNAKATELDKLIKDKRADYDLWISQFYFQVRDSGLTDPNTDASGNGLTNFQKYLLALNPKAYDTLGLGKADGQAIVEGYDPATGQQLQGAKKDIVEKYFDLEAISNRLAAGSVAGANTNQPGYGIGNNITQTTTPIVAGAESTKPANQASPAELNIPSMNLRAPIIWTQATKDFETDLKRGLVHYPGTPLPGEIGTSYISGHSSNYPWIKSNYNKIFAKLDDLNNGETFSITVTNQDGSKSRYNYVVDGKGLFSPTDQAQFANWADSYVALSTCWPPGTTSKRLVVFGRLTQTENLN